MDAPLISEHFVKAVHDKATTIHFQQLMEAQSVMMGTLLEDQVSGLIARVMSKLRENQGAEKKKNERALEDLLLQSLLDYIEQLNRDIQDMEAGFCAKFGDAWREQIALNIFGEDDVPQMFKDETIDEYRKRLEQELVEKMLNGDGTIKAKYKNDPALLKYAEWAQKIHNRNVAEQIANDLKDPNITHPQTQAILQGLAEAKNSEVNLSTADQLEGHEAQKDAILGVDKVAQEERGQVNQSSSSNAFLNSNAP